MIQEYCSAALDLWRAYAERRLSKLHLKGGSPADNRSDWVQIFDCLLIRRPVWICDPCDWDLCTLREWQNLTCHFKLLFLHLLRLQGGMQQSSKEHLNDKTVWISVAYSWLVDGLDSLNTRESIRLMMKPPSYLKWMPFGLRLGFDLMRPKISAAFLTSLLHSAISLVNAGSLAWNVQEFKTWQISPVPGLAFLMW